MWVELREELSSLVYVKYSSFGNFEDYIYEKAKGKYSFIGFSLSLLSTPHSNTHMYTDIYTEAVKQQVLENTYS